MLKRCALAQIVPWLAMIPLGYLLALIGPTFIHQAKRVPTNPPARPITTPPAQR